MTLRRSIHYAISRQRELRAAMLLAESEERYRLLFEDNPHPMWVFDPDSLRFLVVNGARLANSRLRPGRNYRHADRQGLPDRRRHPGDQGIRPGVGRGDRGPALAPRVPAQRRLLRRSRNRDQSIVHRGKEARLVVATDVSEKRRLEIQLLQAQKMEAVGQLAGGVAHDFNNLLGVITGSCEMLAADVAGNPRGQHRVDEITRAAERATALTRQLLAFGRKQMLQPKISTSTWWSTRSPRCCAG